VNEVANDSSECNIDSNIIPLSNFVNDFGRGLLEAAQKTNPPVYDGKPNPLYRSIMRDLSRQPYTEQQEVVQAVTKLLIDANKPAAVINAEMGTGKTIMAIATAAVLSAEGFNRHLVICPPHLTAKWAREIKETMSNARVWVLNGPDTIRKLIGLREMLDQAPIQNGPEFFIMGRVRMRMGFHWRPSIGKRKLHIRKYTEGDDVNSLSFITTIEAACCADCGELIRDEDGEIVSVSSFYSLASDRRKTCPKCNSPFWTLIRPTEQRSKSEIVQKALCSLPTIGPKTADKLRSKFGDDMMLTMLSDNIYEFINLMDESGDLVFSDSQAKRMESALAKTEISFGQGGYQPTEFIKRYLPNKYFATMICDEIHEHKSESSATGQAMGILAGKVNKIVALTGSLMGGYASDLFMLLWRIMPNEMMEDGYCYNKRNSLSSSSLAFMRQHGVLQDIYKEQDDGNHRTSRGSKRSVRTVKAPGFGPQGIARYVLPYTVFLSLKEIGENALPPYDEHYIEVLMSEKQAEKYKSLSTTLKLMMKERLKKGDKSLLGVVLNVLLRWPDTCFRPEVVKHPRTRELLAMVAQVMDEGEVSPKEEKLLEICKAAKANGRRVLVYCTYTGKHDITTRLRAMFQKHHFNVAVLRSSVETSKREDWVLSQVDKGVEVVITNPELVKTGLDMLEFPTIVFLQTGYNVYTLLQASRRSWRIGQSKNVEVYFLGYKETMQIDCLRLMAKKIAVAMSTSGKIPETGLDSLNSDDDSSEVALAKQLTM